MMARRTDAQVVNMLVAAAVQFGDWPEAVLREHAWKCIGVRSGGTAHLLHVFAWSLPDVPHERFRLIEGGARFSLVFDPHLSVLDAELRDGTQIVWEVPARAANDVEADVRPTVGRTPMPMRRTAPRVEETRGKQGAPRRRGFESSGKASAPRRRARELPRKPRAPRRGAGLTTWLTEQEGPVEP